MLSETINIHRKQVDQLIRRLQEVTEGIQHQELIETLKDLRVRIYEPFMFVIVGEVKAGKSSFINALLNTGEEICKVAPSPMTDTIQQIVYGEEPSEVSVNSYLKKISQPVEILKEIAIVDTPGTNTIIEHHQEITERFIPSSDLIVFVFESKNPYRQSAWEFFDFINEEWRRKIIFVLQQKDLMEPADLTINIQGVHDHAIKKGIVEPKVFAVSAKKELEGIVEESGYPALRKYIEDNITGGQAPLLKLQNNLNTATRISERIKDGLDLRQRQFEADVAFREDIKTTLEEQARQSGIQVDTLVENLLAGYDRSTRKTEEELKQGLSFGSLIKRSFSSLFGQEASAKDWLASLSKDLEQDLNKSLGDKLNEGVVLIAESIQQMAKMIDLKIQNSTTILKDNHEIFSDIAERRANVLKELQEAFSKFLSRSESFTDDQIFPEDSQLAPNLMTGGGLAVVGIILTAVTNGAVFDITGGILTTVGLLFAGVSTGFQRRKIIRGYQKEIEKGRDQLEAEVNEKLKTYIGHIKERIDANFTGFDGMLEKEKLQIQQLNQQLEGISGELKELYATIS